MSARDLTVMISVVAIIATLIIPIPTWLLSVLILCNIALALVVLLTAMNMKEPLEFAIFPALLLILTLFRLTLNVSTTRAILTGGDAGNVVESFGSFVVGGNVLVGMVIFLILIVIQFIVITKGSERVSEVAARFTLDAMPGKQMSIDADLNAGLISDTEAKERREKIARESDFYGSMDGASKFVKGDAIASIIIVLINLVFGIIIGVTQLSYSFGDAMAHFSLLTVGDGIVTQVPALLISTATGIVVTRAASKGNLGSDITSQLFAYPKMMYITGATVLLLGLLTPISDVYTIPLAGALIIGGYFMSRAPVEDDKEAIELGEEIQTEEMKKPENMIDLLSVDPIEFEFGYGLVPLADVKQGGDLLDRIVMIRKQLVMELGMVIPVVRVRDNIQLKPNEYRLIIKGDEVARGEVLIDHYLAMSAGVDEDGLIEGVDTVEPSFGLPAKWIDEEMKDQAEIYGYTVVDPPSVISTHVTELIRRHAHLLLGREESKQLIDHLASASPILVEEVTPNPLTVGDIQKVLSKLLKEKISIRNLPVIFETLADYAKITTDTDLLTEYVRQNLAKQITKQYLMNEPTLKVITVSGSIEKTIADAIQQTEHGNYLQLNPNDTQEILSAFAKKLDEISLKGVMPIVLCSPAVRMYIRQLTERYFPQIPILSYNELEAAVELQSVGVVEVG